MAPERRYTTISGDELYRRLAMGEPVVLVDVRTETEFEKQHIPGAMLLPLHELERRVTEVPNSGTPIAMVCEKGMRSASACTLLAEHGFAPLYNLEGGLGAWPGPMAAGSAEEGRTHHGVAPSSFLVESFDLLRPGLALDLCMGEGRNSIYLATRGYDVDGVDADARRVAAARAAARRLNAPIRAILGNVEDGTYIIPIETYDLIVVFNYLHRPLFNDIRGGLVRGGVVVYQTYTTEQTRFGPPRNPDHLLRPGELDEVFSDWEILRRREVVGPARDGRTRAVAGIVARKP